ncbi:MAG TPA: thiamine pyrophosphate-binding protein [Alphaproteobacteria bacterium]|nr:thiamine pyrophosphate-binding protein [Alphaproteobacteria bacterium]
MAKMTGGEALARTLKASGVEYIFGISVGSQAPFTVGAMRLGMRIVTVRNEKCAALMATAYSKISGRPGVCLASSPGAAHLALGMYEAFNSGNAIVAVTSDATAAGLWRPGSTYMDQQGLFQPITKWTARAEALATLPDIARRALRVATAGSPGPVAVIVSTPLFAAEGDFHLPVGAESAHHPAYRVAPGAEPVEQAAQLLLAADRPAIIAGGGVMLSQAAQDLLELAELTAIPVATTHVAHGTFPSAHPLSLGVVGNAVAGNRGRIANQVVGEADVLLVVGSRLDGRTTRGYSLIPPTTKLIQIDIDASEIGSHYAVAVAIVADAKRALEALKATLAGKVTPPASVAETPRAREIAGMVEAWYTEFAPQMHSNAVPIKTPRLFRDIQDFIDENTIVVVDAGGSSYWAAAYLELTPENQALYPRGAAAIGSALPMALGAQLAAPEKRVICISGDGGFGYNVMELETAVRLNLPVVNIIVNNHALGMERRGYLEYAGEVPPAPVSFSPQDFSKIAQALNCFGVRAERPGDIRGAIEAALASGRPAVVDVLTDPEDSDSERTRPWRSY